MIWGSICKRLRLTISKLTTFCLFLFKTLSTTSFMIWSSDTCRKSRLDSRQVTSTTQPFPWFLGSASNLETWIFWWKNATKSLTTCSLTLKSCRFSWQRTSGRVRSIKPSRNLLPRSWSAKLKLSRREGTRGKEELARSFTGTKWMSGTTLRDRRIDQSLERWPEDKSSSNSKKSKTSKM